VVDALDAHHRLLAAAAGVIAGELAERPLGRGLARMHRAFEDDLGMRRHRQAVELALDHVVRRAAVAGGVIIFGKPVTDLVAPGEEEQRIVAAADEHRARLAALEVLLPDRAPVLARRDPQSHAIGPLHHRAIRAAVDPVLFGVAHDHEIVGADVAPAVVLVQFGRRKFENVDLGFDYILQNRPASHDPWRNRLVRLHPIPVGPDDVQRVGGHRKSEHDRHALCRVRRARKRAVAFRVAGNVLEQDRGRRRLAVDDLRERAHLEVPVGAADTAQLARAL
jgi:hypothetical protein